MSDERVQAVGLGVSFVCPARHAHVQTSLPLDQVCVDTYRSIVASVACSVCEDVHDLLIAED